MAAVIKIEIQTSGGVDSVKQDIADIGRAADDAGGHFSAFKEIGIGALRAIGEGAIGLAVKGFQAIGGAISDGIADAKGYAIIAAQTDAVIKSTGGAAGVSAQHIAEYAGALSDAAGASLFGDDQIQQSTNMLLTFTEIKGTVLDAATAISVDMAQALGGAPQDSAIQLGKALNDPIKGITALTRVGVTFTDEQKAQIQAMQEAGDMAGAQGVILAELNKEFGGSAAAAAAATGGWSEFEGRMGEAKETLGAAVLPLLNQLSAVLLSDVLPVVEELAASFAAWLADPAVQAGIQELATAITTGLGVAFTFISETAIPALLAAWAFIQPAIAAILPLFSGDMPAGLQSAGAAFTQLQTTINVVMAGVQAVVNAVLPQITAFWQAHGADIMAFVETTWNRIMEIIRTALQLIAAIVGPALQALAGFISAHGEEIQAFLTSAWNAIKAVIDIALTLIQGVIKAALQIIQGDWSGAWETIKTMCARIVEDLIVLIRSNLEMVVTLFGQMATDVMAALDALPGQALELGRDVVNGIIRGVEGAAGALYDMLSDMASDALDAAKSALGISSPSRDFAQQVGIPIVQGIVQGIQQTTGQLMGALVSVASDAVDHTSNLVAGMSEVLADSGLGSDGEQIGADLLAGIVDGIRSKVDSVMDIINSTADNITDAFKGALEIGSPSAVFANQVGVPIIQGLIEGIQGMIPGLMAVMNTVAQGITSQAEELTVQVQEEAFRMQEAMIKQAESLSDRLGNAMADAFLGTASLERSKAKAISALKDISAARQEETQAQLTAAANIAAEFGDPKQQAAFFKMRQDQIFELAKLKDQIDKTTDEAAKARLMEQFNLIGRAQQAELQAFDSRGPTSALASITAQLQKLLNDPNRPDDPTGVMTQLFNALPQLIAMTTTSGPSAVNSTNTSSFTYAPTVNTTSNIPPWLDWTIARALSGT